MNDINETESKAQNDVQQNIGLKKKRTSLSSVSVRINLFTLCFIIASVLALIGSIVALVLKLGVGLIVLGALLITLGAIAAFNTGKFKALNDENDTLKFPKLSKIGIIILIVSLVLGLSSIAFGIVMCIGYGDNCEEVTYTYDFEKSENIFEAGVDNYCTVKVSPESAGKYIVKIKGAVLKEITTGNGKQIYPLLITGEDGECYSVFLITNLDYFLRLHATDREFSIELNKENIN